MTLHTSSNHEDGKDKPLRPPLLSESPHVNSQPMYTAASHRGQNNNTGDRPRDRLASTNPPPRDKQQKFDGDCIAEGESRIFSAPGRRTYVTSARVAAIRDQLSQRDLAILQTLGMVQVATSQQLEILHFADLATHSRSRRRGMILKRLTNLKVLSRLPRQVGGIQGGSKSYIFALDVLGQRLLGRTKVRTPPTRSWPYLAHVLAVTDLYVQANEAEADGRLDFLRFVAEPQCWSMIEGEVALRPDAVVSVKPAAADWTDHWAVEVDLATERPVRIRKKLLTYWEAFQADGALRGTSVFPKVMLTVPDERRLDECLRVIEGLPTEAQQLIEVVLHEQATALLASGGPS